MLVTEILRGVDILVMKLKNEAFLPAEDTVVKDTMILHLIRHGLSVWRTDHEPRKAFISATQ